MHCFPIGAFLGLTMALADPQPPTLTWTEAWDQAVQTQRQIRVVIGQSSDVLTEQRVIAKKNNDLLVETSETMLVVDSGRIALGQGVHWFSTPVVPQFVGSVDALDEVNQARARRGLRPFAKCPLLTQAALACAQHRAAYRIKGHSSNDFAFVPPGGHATAAGCGGLEPSWGFQACCVDGNYSYAGAAYVIGPDHIQYNQIFVR